VSQHLLLQKGALESVLELQFLIDLPAEFGLTVINQQSCLTVLIHSFFGKKPWNLVVVACLFVSMEISNPH
jgi:hypothetical protein